MPPSDRLLGFVLTAFVLIVIPGPTVLFVVSRGVALGRRAALATVAGNAGGVLVQVVLVALGLGALVERSDAVFTVIELAGAVYLVVLGVRMIRHRKELEPVGQRHRGARGTRTIVREGFIVGLTNPKAAVILTVVLPQFADPAPWARAAAAGIPGRPVPPDRRHLGQRVGDRGRLGPCLARAIAPPAGGAHRCRRRGADRVGTAARAHRPAD